MKDQFIILLSTICLFTIKNPVIKSISCLKEKVINSRFYYPSKSNDYFEFNGDSYNEFVDGKRYSKATIVWTDCENYNLIVQQANYVGGVNVGDTLHVHILSLTKDTLTLTASAFGKTFELKGIKSE